MEFGEGGGKSDWTNMPTPLLVVRYICLHEAYCVHQKDGEKIIPLGKTSLGLRPPLNY